MTTMDSDRPDSASPSLAGPAHYDPNRLRWVPWAFVGFFGVVLLANSAMLWVAFSTWTGLAADRAYDRGIHYNEDARLAALVQDVVFWLAWPTMPSGDDIWAESGGCGSPGTDP